MYRNQFSAPYLISWMSVNSTLRRWVLFILLEQVAKVQCKVQWGWLELSLKFYGVKSRFLNLIMNFMKALKIQPCKP